MSVTAHANLGIHVSVSHVAGGVGDGASVEVVVDVVVDIVAGMSPRMACYKTAK